MVSVDYHHYVERKSSRLMTPRGVIHVSWTFQLWKSFAIFDAPSFLNLEAASFNLGALSHRSLSAPVETRAFHKCLQMLSRYAQGIYDLEAKISGLENELEKDLEIWNYHHPPYSVLCEKEWMAHGCQSKHCTAVLKTLSQLEDFRARWSRRVVLFRILKNTMLAFEKSSDVRRIPALHEREDARQLQVEVSPFPSCIQSYDAGPSPNCEIPLMWANGHVRLL